ncbi:MAG TPA: TonB-dependent receptor [Edaphobacter sp.]|nr:TonB-dependent receptor [Edaphobacter sp.]
MSRFCAAVLSIAALVSVSVAAQTPDTATLQGTVIDPSHAVVAGSHVTVTNESTGLARTVDSDSTGRFTLAGLPVAGDYTVSITKEGFASAQTTHVQLAPGSTAIITPTLKIAGETSVLTVEGTATGLRVDQPQLGINLTSEQMQQTPLLNRRITGLPLLNSANRPAINQGDIFMNEFLITTNGAGRRQAWFEVDGANSIDMWGRQTIFTNIPLMAVDEMSVLTNAFTPAYGGGTGSVVNIVTRSGGSNYHGQLLELWRPAATEASLSGFTTANAASGNDITSDILGQTALALSGPLLSQKTHFFLAGEWNREAKASPVTSPLAPGSFVGHYRGWLGLLRFDHQINDTNNTFLRINFDNFTDTNPNGIVGGASLANVARTFHRRTYSGELGETAILSPRLANNLRMQFQLATPITEFDPVVYSTQFVVPISSGGTFTSGTSQNALLMNRQYELSETLSLTYGRHQISVGGSVIDSHNGGNSKEFGGPIFLGKFTYNTCTQAANVCQSSAYLNNISNVANYQQSFGNQNYTVDDQLAGIFAQDDYRASQRLTINLGFRYERQTFTDAKLNFAPRVGFVYDVLGTSDTIFRAGYGIYHSQIVDNSFASYALGEPSGVFTYTATPGQVGFPASIAAGPLPQFPAGGAVPVRSLYVRPGQSAYLSQWFPTSVLNGYPAAMLNPYSQQWTASLEQKLATRWTMTLDYVGAHTLRIVRPLDVDGPSPFVRTLTGTGPLNIRTAQAANCTRPYWIYFYSHNGGACDPSKNAGPVPAYSVIQTDVNDGYLHYNALDLNIAHSFADRFQMLASYTWSHTLDNVDPDTTSQNPNDTNFTQHQEYGPAIYDQRHRFVLSGVYIIPIVNVQFGGLGTFGSGLPYNFVTGTTNSGNTGGTTDRPVINGAVIGRNAGRGNGQYSVDPFVSRAFALYRDRVVLDLRAEAFNILNHANFVGYSGTYGNGNAPGVGFGAPLPGVTSQLPARSMQFSAKVSF